VLLDGKSAGIADSNGAIKLRDLTQGLHRVRISLDGYETKEAPVQVAPDETVTLSIDLVRIINVYKGPPGVAVPRFVYARSLGGFETTDAFVSNITFSPDGRWLAAVSIANGQAIGRIRIWDAASGKPVSQHPVPDDYKVLALAFSPDGAWLASWYGNSKGSLVWPRGIVLISEAAGEREVCRLSVGDAKGRGHAVFSPAPGWDSLAFSPDGKQLIASSVYGGILWDVRSWQISRSVEEGPTVGQVIFSRNGRWLASANEELSIIDWANGEERVIAKRKGQGFGWVAFSADGRWIAARQDWDLYFWDTSTGAELTPLRGTKGSFAWASFGPEGRWLAEAQIPPGASQDTRELFFQVNIWDMATRQIVQTLEPKLHALPDVPGHKVSLSPDGKWLATAAYPIKNGVGVQIWQAEKK